jgi:glycosyltransferase involved in cell wall biosynthesis
MRYAWDLQHEYLRGSPGMRSALARIMLHRIRLWETATGLRPDFVIANSAFIARRIRKVLGREAIVIHPPVEVSRVAPPSSRQDHFLVAGRLVGYKNVGAVVEAFKLLPELKLIVAGTGPDLKSLQAGAGSNVSFAGFVSDLEMRRLMATARALVFAGEEDFGIIPVEAQAEGTPVLALGRGGATETVVVNGSARTGMFFDEPTPTAIAACINTFVVRESSFSREACRQNAQLFSAARFRRRFTAAVEEALTAARAEIMASRASGHAAPKLAAAVG